MIKDNLDIFSFAKILNQVNQNAAFYITSISGTKKIIEDLKWYLGKYEC